MRVTNQKLHLKAKVPKAESAKAESPVSSLITAHDRGPWTASNASG